MATWFTADPHFGHENIIAYCNRPFGDVREMDEALIANWNERVAGDDRVFILGDFTLSVDRRVVDQYLQDLRGVKFIVPGGHDRWVRRGSYTHGLVHVLEPIHELRVEEYPLIVLCHYAMWVWPRSHYGSWQLFGHSHGRLRGAGLQIDVGVDAHGYAPISVEEVAKLMDERSENTIEGPNAKKAKR